MKIESHKRENRRLTLLIDQQKDDAARLTLRLSGTEKQRDDALEALVLQQEIAEELERERKRNKKELAALRHTNTALIRQRDESQRVVLHLRSLINGQTHHMEHIVRSLNKSPELSNYIAEGYEESPDDIDDHESVTSGEFASAKKTRSGLRSASQPSTLDSESKTGGEHVTPEMESRLLDSILSDKSRASRLSLADVADRHLRDKTDAIADIIRNISDQCAAAVEGLHLAQDAEHDEEPEIEGKVSQSDHLTPSEDGQEQSSVRTDGSENGEASETSNFLSPDGPPNSIPPTPDLVHNRSSTSMSMVSSNLESDRSSTHYHPHTDVGASTKVVVHGEGGDELHERSDDGASSTGHLEPDKAKIGAVTDANNRLGRPATARLVQ